MNQLPLRQVCIIPHPHKMERQEAGEGRRKIFNAISTTRGGCTDCGGFVLSSSPGSCASLHQQYENDPHISYEYTDSEASCFHSFRIPSGFCFDRCRNSLPAPWNLGPAAGARPSRREFFNWALSVQMGQAHSEKGCLK